MTSFSFNQKDFDTMNLIDKRLFIKSQDPRNLLSIAKMSVEYETLISNIYRDGFAVEVIQVDESTRFENNNDEKRGEVFTSMEEFDHFDLLCGGIVDNFIVRVTCVVVNFPDENSTDEKIYTIGGTMNIMYSEFVNFKSSFPALFNLTKYLVKMINCENQDLLSFDEIGEDCYSIIFQNCTFEYGFDGSWLNNVNFTVQFVDCVFEDMVSLECGDCSQLVVTSSSITSEQFDKLFEDVEINTYLVLDGFMPTTESLKKLNIGPGGCVFRKVGDEQEMIHPFYGSTVAKEIKLEASTKFVEFISKMMEENSTVEQQSQVCLDSDILFLTCKDEIIFLVESFKNKESNSVQLTRALWSLVNIVVQHCGNVPFAMINSILTPLSQHMKDPFNAAVFYGKVVEVYKKHEIIDENDFEEREAKRARIE